MRKKAAKVKRGSSSSLGSSPPTSPMSQDPFFGSGDKGDPALVGELDTVNVDAAALGAVVKKRNNKRASQNSISEEPDHRPWIQEARRQSQMSKYSGDFGFDDEDLRAGTPASQYSGFGDDPSEDEYEYNPGRASPAINEDKVLDSQETAVISAILALYQTLDPKGAGFISIDTFKESLEAQGALMTAQDFIELFEEHRIEHENAITLNDFDILFPLAAEYTSINVVNFFNNLDTTTKDYLTIEELQQGLKTLGCALSTDDICSLAVEIGVDASADQAITVAVIEPLIPQLLRAYRVRLRAVFDRIDVDGVGLVTYQDTINSLIDAGYMITEAQQENLLAALGETALSTVAQMQFFKLYKQLVALLDSDMYVILRDISL